MISLEKARALKEAGLEWDLQEGDWFSEPTFAGGRTDTLFGQGFEWDDDDDKNNEDHVWLPRLDQLLAEIEKRGWMWDLRQWSEPGKYVIFITRQEKFERYHSVSDAPEDAAADALLYLLGQEAG
jgi:hypothetical protein